MFQGSGHGDLRNKILFLGILVSHKRSDLLFNTADLLSATWSSPAAEQGRAKSQFFHSQIRTQGTKPGNHSSPAGNLVLLKMRFGKCPGSAALV